MPPQLPIPPPPTNLAETGLSEPFLADLVLKHIFFGGTLDGIEIARRTALDFHIVSQLLEGLKAEQLIAPRGGSGAFGGVWLRWTPTRKGSERVEEILLRDNYRGPAPVPFEQYVALLERQSLREHRISPEDVERGFRSLVLPPGFLDRMGPAVASGRSIFLYGPPGNGKTAMAECIAETIQGGVFVPRAVLVESEIVEIFDEGVHRPIEADFKYDPRWVYARRPVVVVGGELTLEMLELSTPANATFYKAPFQVKANSGVLFIDDFGRQRVDPQQLLNRWIVPLENRVDYLSFRSGKKVAFPFDSLVVFSTNLNPRDLVDDAFLRRMRYKILVDYPDEARYAEIFRRVCRRLGIDFEPSVLEYLLEHHYRRPGRPLRACEPRDLVEQLVDLARYRGEEVRLDARSIERVARSYFAEV